MCLTLRNRVDNVVAVDISDTPGFNIESILKENFLFYYKT